MTGNDTIQRTLNGDRDETRVGHCKKDPIEVYIGRADDGDAHMGTADIHERGWLGNPFPESKYGRTECIRRFRADFEVRLQLDEEFREAIANLQGRILGCYCQRLTDDGPACHGEVIAEWADKLAEDDA